MSYTKGKWEVSINGLAVVAQGKRIMNCNLDNQRITDKEHTANAARICQSINNHDALLDACKIGLKYANKSSKRQKPDCLVCKETDTDISSINQIIADAESEE